MATTTLEGTPGSVPAARRWTRATLTDWGLPSAAWTTAQVVSELATNCTLHARTAFTLTLELSDSRLRLEVTDSSPTVLQPRLQSETATTGRGLRIVDSLAVQWGVVARGSGKTVWAELPVDAGDDDDGDDDVRGHADQPAAHGSLGRGAAGRAPGRVRAAVGPLHVA